MEYSFSRNLSLQGGWYGNAILSKYPVYFSENKILSKRDGDEPRGVLHTIISVHNKKLHIYGTHLSTDSLHSSAELKELLNHALDWGLDEPVIIAGDLNMPPSSKRIHDLTYYFYDVGALAQQEKMTYPSANPDKRIDYIFMNDKLSPLSVQTVDNDFSRVASDHLPVVAKFRIK